MEEIHTRIDLDKLPINRLEAIEETGIEHFPTEIGHEEKRLNMIRRIDFSSVVEKEKEKDAKKPKTTASDNSTKEDGPPPKPWQTMLDNLHLAHQELSIIMDLITTVEANDAVSVAGMQRPKLLPNEVLPDLAVSAATKLQRLRNLGRYFKQSSKALEQQVVREARFYGSLIRLQQNWKVKRQRLGVAGPGSDGFTIDLLDNSVSDLMGLSRPSPLSTVRIDHDSAGVLAIQLPLKLCRSLCLGFHGAHSSSKLNSYSSRKTYSTEGHSRQVKKDDLTDEDVNICVKETHLNLREIHQSIFQEQVFDMVNRETCNPSLGVNVTGIREDFFQLAIGQDASLCLCLVPCGREGSFKTSDSTSQLQDGESGVSDPDSLEMMVLDDKHDPLKKNLSGFPSPDSLEIHLQCIFHENALIKAKERHASGVRLQVGSQPAGDGCGLLGHFCMTVAHRIFSNKVLSELENLVGRVPYLHLLSHPTWHSRTSSWSLTLKVPKSTLPSCRRVESSDIHDVKGGIKSNFHTKVVVNDDRITVTGEGAPSIIDSFRGSSTDLCSIDCYGCDLEDLPMILLQQVASQVIHWLHQEALVVGMKVSRDFLCLYFDLDQGETLGLVAHVDPDDVQGCISWWVVMDNGSMEEGKLSAENDGSEYKRFLGHLSLEALYSTLMDLVRVCSTGGSHW